MIRSQDYPDFDADNVGIAWSVYKIERYEK